MAKRASHLPSYRERLGLQAIHNGRPLPDGVGPATIANLIGKGWITRLGRSKFQVTEVGVAALKMKLP